MRREHIEHGVRVVLDLGPQVVDLEIPERGRMGRVDAALAATLPQEAAARTVSAAMLAQKAKQFDDGLYAAVELLVERGLGRHPGKPALVRELAARLGAEGGRAACALHAACALGGIDVATPPALREMVAGAVAEFLADPVRSKPIGFYTWSEELARIFRRDRALQTELPPSEELVRAARALDASPALRAAYDAHLDVVTRLTNPLAGPDLRAVLAALEARRELSPERPHPAWFPPSRAPETDLLKRLFGDRDPPRGYVLLDELCARVRDGSVDLTPSARDGWYAHQLFSFAPLLAPERAPEARRLRTGPRYRRHLEDLFRALWALTRETHVKQLVTMGGAAGILVGPEFSVEPLPTHYARRARAYRFVRTLLTEVFGSALADVGRMTARGPVGRSLAEELAAMEQLFRGAAATACHELGEAPEMLLGDEWDGDAGRDAVAFAAWAEHADGDEDLAADARMMVPVGVERDGRVRAWVFLGWKTEVARATFATPPSVATIESLEPEATHQPPSRLQGKLAALRSRRGLPPLEDPEPPAPRRPLPHVSFVESNVPLATPVVAEVLVRAPLDRDEFRALCDRHRTREAILAALR